MNFKLASIPVALAACFLAACGGNGPSLPRTPANLAVCKVLTQTISGKASVQELAAMVLESNAPVTHQLRQDVASYAVLAATGGAGAVQQAQTKAAQDCASVEGG